MLQRSAFAKQAAATHAEPDREQRHLVGRQPAPRRPARDVARVGRDEERGEEAVRALDRRVEQLAVLVVLEDVGGGALERDRRAGAGPEQRAQVRGGDVHARAHEPDQQQRGHVVRRDRAPALELGGVLGRERGGVELLARRRRRAALARRARTARACAASGRPCSRAPPASRRRRIDELGEPLGDRRDAHAIGRRDLEHAEERAGRLAHGVVRRAGGDDAPAARAGLEAVRARDGAAGGEDAGADARLLEQPGQHLALGDDVGVGDHERARRALGDAADRAQVVSRRVARVQLGAVGGGAHRVGPGGPRQHVQLGDAEAGELRDEAREQRLALPRLERRGRAVGERRGRHQHGRRARHGRDRPAGPHAAAR